MDAPAQFAASLYDDLGRLTGVPAAAVKVAAERQRPAGEKEDREEVDPAEQQARRALIDALYAAGDDPARKTEGAKQAKPEKGGTLEKESATKAAGAAPLPPVNSADDGCEPGWGALAYWIEETTYLHALRRTAFLTDSLSVDPDDYIRSMMPLVEHHPYRAAIEAFAYNANVKRAALDRIVHLPLQGLDLRQRTLFDLLQGVNNEARLNAWRWEVSCLAETADDYSLYMANIADSAKEECAVPLAKLSPHNPAAMAVLIALHWDRYKDRVDETMELAESYPLLATALGRKFYDLKQFDKAERMFKTAVALEPSFDSYSRLASLYRVQGDLEKFRKTLGTYLEKEPDFGLYHAQANNLIAWSYIRQAEWDKARPFAEAAANSGAEWGMQTAAVVYEGLRQLDKAEETSLAAAERYSKFDFAYCYLFCRRNGRDLNNATRAGWEQWLKERQRQPGGDRVVLIALASMMDGKEADALPVLQRAFEIDNDPLSGLSAALVADRLGNAALRDKLLAAVRERGGRFIDSGLGRPRQNLIDLATLFADDLSKHGKGTLDLAKAEAICKRGEANLINMAAYLVGEYLAQHGAMDDAKRFSLHAIEEPMPLALFFNMSTYRLRQSGVTPEDYEALRKRLGLKERWGGK